MRAELLFVRVNAGPGNLSSMNASASCQRRAVRRGADLPHTRAPWSRVISPFVGSRAAVEFDHRRLTLTVRQQDDAEIKADAKSTSENKSFSSSAPGT